MHNRKRWLVIFGTRPEAIKMAPLVKLMESHTEIDFRVCVTAQHRGLLDQVLSFYQITPHYDLDLMQANQNLNEFSARLFNAINEVYCKWEPDLVFVHGDTTTSMICAIAAFNLQIKIAHIEAGLRTLDLKSPFPEEMNRQVTARMADFHFAPTEKATKNLINEGIHLAKILLVGNTVIDSLLLTIEKIKTGYENDEIIKIKKTIDSNLPFILVTGHRRENFGDGFLNICNSLKEITKQNKVQIIYPVHLNPNVQKTVMAILGDVDNVHLIAPVSYPTFVWLMQGSKFIITDSGGVQEEAPVLGKPIIVLRNTSERPEVIEAGAAVLVGTNGEAILEEANRLLQDELYFFKRAVTISPYGNGDAANKIVDYLLEMNP